jgi:hypothetical protein
MNMPLPAPSKTRGRRILLVVLAVFFAPIALAWLFNLGHILPAPKTNGEYLQPMTDLRAVVPTLADGGDYHWNPADRRWRIAIAPPSGCAAACVEIARKADLVWQLLGQNADHVDILWIGAPPPDAKRNAATRVLRADPALRAKLPRVDDAQGVPVYVIDPNGFVVLRYAPGFAPKGLLDDVTKLAKLM